jgi:hypothetical protein
MARELLAVGWDVGGWRGDKQAVAVCCAGQGKAQWLGDQVRFRITKPQDKGGTLEALVHLAWPEAPHDLWDRYRPVLAIDAPLGFPKAFVDLLNGKSPVIPLAYRETDRHIHKTFTKKPLSASFDRLGNNATVAISFARHWGARMLPFDEDDGHSPLIIEVYPALVKQPKSPICYRTIRRLLPRGLKANSDEHDAAVCAIMALAFGLKGQRDWLPKLERPNGHIERDVTRTEGWIYYAPRDWLED